MQVGVNSIYQTTESYVTLADGSKFYLCTGYNSSSRHFSVPGTAIVADASSFPLVFSTGCSMEWRSVSDTESSIDFLGLSGELAARLPVYLPLLPRQWPMYVGIYGSSPYITTAFMHPYLDASSLFLSFSSSSVFDIGVPVSVDESFGLDRSESMSYMPDDLAAEQGIALDVGAAATMDLDLVLKGVLEDVIAGTLASSMEAAGEVAVDPPAGEITDVDGLGLPALGAALTSRFPFSIPWDFFRAVQLLAAPAKAPYFEVDFLEPLADDVGGWQGSTTVVLDFGQYAIIGQISRWTSTIGFCLMLAGATKRLIWTA